MTDKVITELYEDMFDRLHIFESGRKERNKIVQENEAEIRKIVGEDNFLKIDEFIGAGNSENSRYAFVVGFKYAMRLILACCSDTDNLHTMESEEQEK